MVFTIVLTGIILPGSGYGMSLVVVLAEGCALLLWCFYTLGYGTVRNCSIVIHKTAELSGSNFRVSGLYRVRIQYQGFEFVTISLRGRCSKALVS